MNYKPSIITLISTWQKRTGLSWATVYKQLGISRDKFNAAYRRFPERKVKYEPQEICHLIQIFDGQYQACHTIECVLLWGWCNYNLTELTPFIEFFKDDKRLSEFILAWLLLLLKPNIFRDWFLSEELQIEIKQEFMHVAIRTNKKFLPTIQHLILQLSKTPTPQQEINSRENLSIFEASSLELQALYGHQIQHTINGLEKQSIDHKPITHIARDHINLAVALIKYSDYEKVKDVLKNTKQNAHEAEDKIKIYANEGANAFYGGYFDEAYSLLERADQSARINNAYIIQSYTRMALACVFSERGEYDQANQYFKEAFQLVTHIKYKRKKLERLAFIACNRAANAYYDDDYYQSNLWYKETALLLQDLPEHHELRVQYLWGKAQLQAVGNDYVNALQTLEEARHIADENQLIWLLAKLDIEVGRLFLMKNNLSMGSDYLENCLIKHLKSRQELSSYTSAQLLYHYIAVRLLQLNNQDARLILQPLSDHLDQLHINTSDLNKWMPYLHRRFQRGRLHLNEDMQATIENILYTN